MFIIKNIDTERERETEILSMQVCGKFIALSFRKIKRRQKVENMKKKKKQQKEKILELSTEQHHLHKYKIVEEPILACFRKHSTVAHK